MNLCAWRDYLLNNRKEMEKYSNMQMLIERECVVCGLLYRMNVCQKEQKWLCTTAGFFPFCNVEIRSRYLRRNIKIS